MKTFPIQSTVRFDEHWPNGEATSIPWWLAEVAYAEYAVQFGTSQSIERLAERGGFGRQELLTLLQLKKCC